MDASRFPVDFDTLDKGCVIETAVIEKWRQAKCPGAEFRLAALQLRDELDRQLRLRGKAVVIVCDRLTLRLLTDAEASAHTFDMFHQRLRQAVREHRRQLEVDPTQLTDDERALHERNVLNSSRYVQALASGGSRYRLVAYERANPGLPSVVPAPKEQTDVRDA